MWVTGHTQRHEQRPEQDRIRQRLRDFVVALAIGVERRQRSPEPLPGSLLQVVCDRLEQPAFCHHPERLLRRTRTKKLVELLDESCGCTPCNFAPAGGDRRIDWRVDGKAEPRGHRNRTKHAHRILVEALGRITDRANQPRPQILEAACVIDDGERPDVVEQRVDREVAPEGILLGSAKRVLAVDQAIGSLTSILRRLMPGTRGLLCGGQFFGAQLTPEGCDFNRLGAEPDMCQPEPAADDPAVLEQALDLIRMG